MAGHRPEQELPVLRAPVRDMAGVLERMLFALTNKRFSGQKVCPSPWSKLSSSAIVSTCCLASSSVNCYYF